MLRVERLSFRYGNSVDSFALADVSLDISSEETIGIVGPSGSGKSTLLRLIAGFLRPSGGSIVLEARELRSEMSWRRGIQLVPQSLSIFGHLTVRENALFAARDKSAAGLGLELLERLGMTQLLEVRASSLSQGQAQRLAIVRAVVAKPRVLLLDEPTAALDARMRARFRETLQEVKRGSGTSVLVVTHDSQFAFSSCSRVAVMEEGRLSELLPVSAVYAEPGSLAGAFLGSELNLISIVAPSEIAAMLNSIGIQTDGGSGGIAIMPEDELIVMRPDAVRCTKSGPGGEPRWLVVGAYQTLGGAILELERANRRFTAFAGTSADCALGDRVSVWMERWDSVFIASRNGAVRRVKTEHSVAGH